MKILAIDGMGAPGIIWNTLILPMADKFKLSPKEIQYSEWQNWERYSGSDWDVIIGHSLGGDSAIQLCNWLAKQGRPQPKLLMTLAPRHQSFASWFDFLIPLGIQGFVAPNKVTHNFYTPPPLPSQSMPGAVENVNVFPYWHGSVPQAPAVQKCLADFLSSAIEDVK